MTRHFARLAFLIVVGFGSGCGGSDPNRVPLHPVSGRVLVDGRPAAGVEVRFRPADDPASLDALAPFARTDEDGGYVLGTYEKGDGAPVGRYKVTLFWPDRPPGPGGAEDLLGGVYTLADRTPLDATVQEGGGSIPAFEVEKPAASSARASARKNQQPYDIDGQ